MQWKKAKAQEVTFSRKLKAVPHPSVIFNNNPLRRDQVNLLFYGPDRPILSKNKNIMLRNSG